MRTWVACMFLTLGCTPPSQVPQRGTQASAPNPDDDEPAPRTTRDTSDPSTLGSDAARLGRECDQGNALSCTVLGNALQDADPMVSGARRDLVAATRYWLKGCTLGDPSSCYSAGEAFAKGKGVDANDRTAVRLLKQACDTDSYRNMMQGFACADEARALLRIDLIENYDSAMSILGKACSLQSSTCDTRAFYRGTGLKSDHNAPRGAVGFTFGDSVNVVEATCKEHGGRPSRDAKGDALTCTDYFVDTLKLKSKWVSLNLCSKSVCGVEIVIDGGGRAMKTYLELKETLTEGYGTAGKIVLDWPKKCRGSDEAFFGCIEDGTAKVSSYWEWQSDESLSLQIASSKDTHAVLLGYMAPAMSKRIGTSGL